MIASVTRLRIRSWSFLPGFLFHAVTSERQASGDPSNVVIKARYERWLAFWNITVWPDLESMRAFPNSQWHLKAMPRLY